MFYQLFLYAEVGFGVAVTAPMLVLQSLWLLRYWCFVIRGIFHVYLVSFVCYASSKCYYRQYNYQFPSAAHRNFVSESSTVYTLQQCIIVRCMRFTYWFNYINTARLNAWHSCTIGNLLSSSYTNILRDVSLFIIGMVYQLQFIIIN